MSDTPAITGSPDAPAAAGRPPLYFIHGMWSTPAVWAGLRERFRQHPAVRAALPEITNDVRSGVLAASVAARRLLDLMNRRED